MHKSGHKADIGGWSQHLEAAAKLGHADAKALKNEAEIEAHGEALYTLGERFYKGQGFPRIPYIAAQYFDQARSKENAKADYALAVLKLAELGRIIKNNSSKEKGTLLFRGAPRTIGNGALETQIIAHLESAKKLDLVEAQSLLTELLGQGYLGAAERYRLAETSPPDFSIP